MTHPYNKHDFILDRDLTPAERLEPQRVALRYARQRLEQFERILDNASDRLTESDLSTICEAVDNALAAAENTCFLGISGYHPQPVHAVGMGEERRDPALVNTLHSYDNGIFVLDDFAEDYANTLTEEERNEIEGGDESEGLRYSVINGETVVVSDDASGDVYGVYTVSEFVRHTAEYLADWREEKGR